ncbi:hypothetical protein SAMN03159341_101435 [Paenibacillus sp. 1_12]|nr:hypothetical protein SAMN03159341_101435 [Paenibacillus sp. 1_12]
MVTANHVTLEQMKYWTSKLNTDSPFKAIPSSTRFVPLYVSELPSGVSASSLVVRVGPTSIELQKASILSCFAKP